MNKAILIVDMPRMCITCMFCKKEKDGTYFCDARIHTDKSINIQNLYETIITNTKRKMSWCPLKAIPNKLENLDLEVWETMRGNILAPMGTFDEMFENKEE